MSDFLIHVGILILLPIIPAGLMFALFRSEGRSRGQLFGFRWSFGGAFAGYLIILLILWAVMQKRIETNDAEVWTVHGKVEPGEIKDIANRMEIKIIPQSMQPAEDGQYEFKVIVLRSGNYLEFPRIRFDLTRLCGDIKTVQLDDAPGTFDAIPKFRPIKVIKETDSRSIYISPIELPKSPSDGSCGSST